MIRSNCACVALVWILCACNHEGSVGVVCLKGDCSEALTEADHAGEANGLGEASVSLDSCRSQPLTLARQELALYLSIDSSYGMVFWWTLLFEGLDRFLAEPASHGLNVGFGFSSDACEAATYTVPNVPFAALPGGREQLLAGYPIQPISLQSAALPALVGAHEYARRWSIEHPQHYVVVVVVTNTIVEACQTSVSEMARVAAERLSDPVIAIPTWTLALGGEGLDPIAKAGGFSEALVAENMVDSILQRLNELRDGIQLPDDLPCRFSLPPGEKFDPQHTQLRFRLRDGSEQTLDPVADLEGCAAVGGGFYRPVDSDAVLLLCPSSCDALRDVTTVDLLSGCAGP